MKVEIWSDVVCPWCFIGRRRLEAAIAAFPHRDQVDVVYRSFELDPGHEGEPEPTAQLLARKYRRPVSAIMPMFEQVTALAAAEGLAFRLAETVSGNTFDAHRLIHHARSQGAGEVMAEQLMQAYFVQARSVFDTEALVALAREAGLDADAARAVLESGAYADQVRADEAQAQAYGATGVPFFVVDGRYGISGAQPVAVFAQALDTAWATRHPVEPERSAVEGDAPTDGALAETGDEGACTI